MHDWNVVATAYEHGYREARALLATIGSTAETEFFNVLVMRVADPTEVLPALTAIGAADPGALASLARVVPVTTCFSFQSPTTFEAQARTAILPRLPELAGRSLYVRMHRRGFKGRLSSRDQERLLAEFIFEQLQRQGADARVCFEDPDVIIALESVGQRAGLSVWERELRARYPLLRLD